MKKSANKKLLIGMVHVGALPGTPFYKNNFDEVVQTAVNEAKVLSAAGFNALILENMHDIPYLRGNVGPEITACMSVVASEVRAVTNVDLGIQILAAANESALSVAQAVDAQFIRVEAFVFSHVADEGIIDACAGPLLRLRRELGAEKIKIYADIKKKHSAHAITSDVSIAETAHAAEFFGADGVIVTGTATGTSASPKELKEVKKATHLPVWIGSGITPKNMSQFKDADGFIVGSYLKKNGDWRNPLDPSAIKNITGASKKLLR